MNETFFVSSRTVAAEANGIAAIMMVRIIKITDVDLIKYFFIMQNSS